MYGVILWSGCAGQKALIWCEDHADLALFDNGDEMHAFTVGDMVSFELDETQAERRATKMKLITKQYHPELPAALLNAAKTATRTPQKTAPEQPAQSAEIIAFPQPQRAKALTPEEYGDNSGEGTVYYASFAR